MGPHHQNVALSYDVGKISAGCLVTLDFTLIAVYELKLADCLANSSISLHHMLAILLLRAAKRRFFKSF